MSRSGRVMLMYNNILVCVLVMLTVLMEVYLVNGEEFAAAAADAQLSTSWSTIGSGQQQQVVVALTSASIRYKLLVQELPEAPAGRPKCYATVNDYSDVGNVQADPLQVWAANYLSNDIYIAGGICTLELGVDGNLVLSQSGSPIWSSQTANKGVQSVELQNTGNLVLLTSAKSIVWQSFANPSDTLVSGQKFPLGSILFAADPNWSYSSAGIYSARVQEYTNDLSLFVGFDHPGYTGPIPVYNQSFGSDRYWTLETVYAEIANTWSAYEARYVEVDNGITIFGTDDAEFKHAPSNNLNPNKTFPEYARLEPDGNFKTYVLMTSFDQGSSSSSSGSRWELNFQALFSLCEFPNACGPYGICSGVYGPTQKCIGCPTGFIPINPAQLNQGCKPATGNPPSSSTLTCSNDATIMELDGTGYSLLQSFFWAGDLSPVYPALLSYDDAQCKAACLADCDCTAAFLYNTSLYFPGQQECFKLHSSVRSLLQTFSDPPTYHSAFIKLL